MDPTLYGAIASTNVAELKRISSHVLLNSTTHQSNTALHVAVQFGIKECVEVIYSKCPSLLTRVNLRGDTALHMAARTGLVDVVKFFIDHVPKDEERGGAGAPEQLIRMVNEKKDTALHEAVLNHHNEIVKLLTEADNEFEYAENDAGQTPLCMAVERESSDMVKQILNTCASAANGGPDGRTALHTAIILDAADIAKLLLEKQPHLIKVADKKGWTPLHSAACRGAIELIEEIIQHCPDSWELLDQRGQNFLHVAVRYDQHKVVEKFLESNKLVEDGLLNDPDNDGSTPLHLAVLSGKSEMVKLFTENGRVEKNAINNMNLTAVDIAHQKNEEEIVEHVTKAGGVLSGTKQMIEREEDKKVVAVKTKTQVKRTAQIKKGDDGSDSRLVVATLILTVTFTAGLTLPGGFKSDGGPDDGMATLARNAAFKAFVIFNSLAVATSAIAVFAHFISTMEDKDDKIREFCISAATQCTNFAVLPMVLAFTTGSYAILSNAHGLAIAVCVIGSFISYLVSSRILENVGIE